MYILKFKVRFEIAYSFLALYTFFTSTTNRYTTLKFHNHIKKHTYWRCFRGNLHTICKSCDSRLGRFYIIRQWRRKHDAWKWEIQRRKLIRSSACEPAKEATRRPFCYTGASKSNSSIQTLGIDSRLLAEQMIDNQVLPILISVLK